MKQARDILWEGIGSKLRQQNELVTHEPLPKRWVDLIRHLDEQERRAAARTHPTTETPR